MRMTVDEGTGYYAKWSPAALAYNFQQMGNSWIGRIPSNAWDGQDRSAHNLQSGGSISSRPRQADRVARLA
jgi:hypothetical protein